MDSQSLIFFISRTNWECGNSLVCVGCRPGGILRCVCDINPCVDLTDLFFYEILESYFVWTELGLFQHNAICYVVTLKDRSAVPFAKRV